MQGLFRLLRVSQWYKNLLVFAALIFSKNLFNIDSLVSSLIGFVSLCFVSAAGYILNDIADAPLDKLHPEKKHRPIASGKIPLWLACAFVMVLIVLGFGLSLLLPASFTYSLLAIFVVFQVYTLWLKREPFADVIAISVNFVLRAVAGCFAINVWVSPWLITVIFFLALFLVIGKRVSDISTFDVLAEKHRGVASFYDRRTSKMFVLIVTACLLTAYSLYVFFGIHKYLFITLPIVIYAVFRYLYFIEKNSKIALKPELVFKDVRMVVAMFLWVVLVFIAVYFPLFPK